MKSQKITEAGGKKAVSPLIATVLLIGIVLVASAMIIVWSKAFIGEHLAKYGERTDLVCGRISYDAILSEGQTTETYDIIVNNQGNDNIHQFNLKFISGGNSVIKTYTPEGNKIGKTETGKITFSVAEFPKEVKTFEKIEITPVLLGTGVKTNKAKLTVCKEKTKVLKLQI